MAEPSADGSENFNGENNPLSHSGAIHEDRDLISREDNRDDDDDDVSEPLNKSYGDGAANEICAFKLDQEKIDELASDYRAETCVSLGRGNAIRNELREAAVKSDGLSSRNEDESRCASGRVRKTRRKMPDGVIVDLGSDIYSSAARGGVKISVISMRRLMSRLVAVPHSELAFQRNKRKKRPRSSTRNHSLKRTGMIDNPVLAVFYSEDCGELRKAERSAERKCGVHQRAMKCTECDAIGSTKNTSRPNVKTAASVPSQSGSMRNERRFRKGNNLHSLRALPGILDSTERHRHDDTEQTCVGSSCEHNFCRSIFNDDHREHHICDQEDYEESDCDVDPETPAGCTEYAHTARYQCTCESSECCHDINIQHDCCLFSARTEELMKNFVPPTERQRKGVALEFGSDAPRANVAPEFATEADEYSPEVELGNWCANCDRKRSSASTFQKCAETMTATTPTTTTTTMTNTFVVAGGSSTDLRDSVAANASRAEIDMRPGKRERTMAQANDEQSNKSDSQKAADTWDAHERRDCTGRCGGRVVAVPSRPDQSPGKKGAFARGVDSKWKHGSIETDAQQLDYKWKRRIAAVDANARAGADFKRKRDSRSQTRSNDTNAEGKCNETRDYSFWTSLRISKIWVQMHDACKNVVKLVASNARSVVKDASKSGRSRRNPVEVADVTLDESLPSYAGGMCGETCRKNLIHSKDGEKSTAHQKRTIENVGKYHGYTETSPEKNLRMITSSFQRDVQNRVCKNVAEKGETGKLCRFCGGHERDRYRNIMKPPLRNDIYDRYEGVYPQFLVSGSFTDLKELPGLRTRGGADDLRDFSSNRTENRQDSADENDEDKESSERHHDLTQKNFTCRTRNQSTCSSHPKNPNSQNITGYPEVLNACEYTRSATDSAIEEGSNLMSVEITDSTMSPAEADSTVYSSWNEPIASTSKWESTLVSSEKSREKRPVSRSLRFARTMEFCRKRPAIDNIAEEPVLKRKRSIEKKEEPSVAGRDSAMKITQIEPCTVQTAREGNKRWSCVNDRAQTFDATVTRILSKFLVNNDGGKRVLMSIALLSGSEHDISNKKTASSTETGTQTPLSDVTSTGTDAFDCPDGYPSAANAPMSRAVQCYICRKRDCYEITRFDDSISLEEALLGGSELGSHFAEREDHEISPQFLPEDASSSTGQSAAAQDIERHL